MSQSISTNETNTTSKSHRPKDQRPLIIGMVVCAVLAIAGIGVGAYGIINSNSKSDEISQLKVEIKNKDQKLASFETSGLTLSDDGTTVEITDSALAQTNPVIPYLSDGVEYSPAYESAKIFPDGYTEGHVSINLQDGDISGCKVYSDGKIVNDQCTITGVSGKIYKIVDAGAGQSYSGEAALILADGTVQYFDLVELAKTGTTGIKGTYNIDGHVVDAVEATARATDSLYGGYGTTLFILSDGSVIPYDQISQ